MKVERETVYQCDQCGKKDTWSKSWSAWTCFFGPHNEAGWEHEFHTCSDECHNELSRLTKPKLKQLANGKREKPKKEFKPIKALSLKRKKESGEYTVLRKQYMEGHLECEARLSVCSGQSEELHHRAGRIGSLYLDVTYFMAVCPECHRYITEHPAEALKLGFAMKRLSIK